MANLIAYLHFDGNTTEAMTFYKGVFGGELDLQKIGDSPMAGQMPDAGDKIMHSTLKTPEFTLMASDMMDDGVVKGTRYSLCLDCKSKEEAQELFAKLSEGGSVTHPLKEEFWGTFGDCTDKYGVDWMFNFMAQQSA